jgi:hypothetical protein
MITVEKLIKILQGVENKRAVVILSRDSEGNNFSPLDKRISDQYMITKHFDLAEGEDAPSGSKACVVLWPE